MAFLNVLDITKRQIQHQKRGLTWKQLHYFNTTRKTHIYYLPCDVLFCLLSYTAASKTLSPWIFTKSQNCLGRHIRLNVHCGSNTVVIHFRELLCLVLFWSLIQHGEKSSIACYCAETCFNLSQPLGFCCREIKKHKFNYPSSPLQITLKPIHRAHYDYVTLGILFSFLISLSLCSFIITAGSCHCCSTSGLHECETMEESNKDPDRYSCTYTF